MVKKRKNILIISTPNPYRVAGVVAYNFFNGFKKKRYDVKLLVKHFDNYEDGIISVNSKLSEHFISIRRKIYEKLYKYVLKRIIREKRIIKDEKYHFLTINETRNIVSTKTILKRIKFKPDIILLIFTHNFLSAKNIYELYKNTNAPIIWQLADEIAFTGGCHYSWNCKSYENNCGNCPALRYPGSTDISYKNMKFKEEYLSKTNISFVAASDGILYKAKKSIIFKDKKYAKIPFSVNINEFNPVTKIEKSRLREKLGLPQDSLIVLVSSIDLAHKRKGIDLIFKALSRIKLKIISEKKLFLLIVGLNFTKVAGFLRKEIPFKHIINIERKMLSNIYQVSDFMISASLQDVGPYMIVESLLCGVPVVSFNTGWANDFVITGQTGFLVDDLTVSALENGFMRMLNLDDEEFEKMKMNAIKRTRPMIDIKSQVKKFEILFDELLNE